MSTESAVHLLDPPTEIVRLGALEAEGPRAIIERASEIATVLADLIRSRGLFTKIAGKAYVRVEGWSTLGAMLGVVPREAGVEFSRFEDANGVHVERHEAIVELVRVTDGAVIGRGSAEVSTDEPRWRGRDRYARRSMAITRATGKAFRLSFSWIMALAGYEPTPAEEIDMAANDERRAALSAHSANGNHAAAAKQDSITRFWAKVNEAGVSRATAMDYVEASNRDFDAALELLEQSVV